VRRLKEWKVIEQTLGRAGQLSNGVYLSKTTTAAFIELLLGRQTWLSGLQFVAREPQSQSAALQKIMQRSPFKRPDDLVFANRKGRPLSRRNLLNRQLKPTARKLGLPAEIDFYSFRKMHSTLMRKSGARAEVVRDNMGHTEVDVTLDIYSKSYWKERVDAVTNTADSIWPANTNKARRRRARQVSGAPAQGKETPKGSELEPLQLEPHTVFGAGEIASQTKEWSGREDLNLRPPGPEPGALPG
jgi:integrase